MAIQHYITQLSQTNRVICYTRTTDFHALVVRQNTNQSSGRAIHFCLSLYQSQTSLLSS